jgi:hypothetical protein
MEEGEGMAPINYISTETNAVLVVGMDWPFTKPDSSWTAGTRLM